MMKTKIVQESSACRDQSISDLSSVPMVSAPGSPTPPWSKHGSPAVRAGSRQPLKAQIIVKVTVVHGVTINCSIRCFTILAPLQTENV